MPKPFPLGIEVEEAALGAVLRKLNETPGIVKIHFNFDLLRKPQPTPRSNGHGGSLQQTVLALLLEAPKTVAEIHDTIGGKRNRAHGALHHLKKLGLANNVGGRWQPTAKAQNAIAGVEPPALPPPAKKGPKGRASTGVARSVMLAALAAAPLRPIEIKAALAAAGLSSKSTSGLVDRGKRDGLIKKNADGVYELTAAGRKAGAANG